MTSMSKVHNTEQWIYGMYTYAQLVPDGLGLGGGGDNQEDKACGIAAYATTNGTVTGDPSTEIIGVLSIAQGNLNNGNAYGIKVENKVSGTTNNYGIYIKTTTGATSNYDIYAGSGATLTTGGVWTDASDRNKKKNIKTLNYGLKEVLALNPVQYKLKINGRKDIGFIAQDMKKVIPELVYGNDGDMSLSYGQLSSVLTKAIQEQQDLINELTNKLNAQQTENDQYKKLLEALTQKDTLRENEIDQLKSLLEAIIQINELDRGNDKAEK